MAVRAFAIPASGTRRRRSLRPLRKPSSSLEPSGWTLTYDSEFEVDAAQQLRVGSYQIRNGGKLVEPGLLFDPLSLADRDRDVIYRFALDRSLMVRDVGEFVEDVFFRVLVDWNGTCIGFGLPGDLAKLALRHDTSTSADMHGGFTLILSENPRRPRVQIRHLNSAQAFIRFSYPARQPTPRGMRRRGFVVPRTRGSFVDVRTAAAALIEHRGELRSLAKLLGTDTQKGSADFADPAITPGFLEYAMADAQVTWECFQLLAARYATLALETPLSRIYSAASLAKAELETMGVRPWL
jgi:hypothetical protein